MTANKYSEISSVKFWFMHNIKFLLLHSLPNQKKSLFTAESVFCEPRVWSVVQSVSWMVVKRDLLMFSGAGLGVRCTELLLINSRAGWLIWKILLFISGQLTNYYIRMLYIGVSQFVCPHESSEIQSIQWTIMQSVTGLVRVKPFGKTVIMEQQITAKNLIY